VSTSIPATVPTEADGSHVPATLRDRLLRAASDIPEEVIDVPKIGTVLCRGLLARDSAALMSTASESGNDMSQTYPQFVVLGCFDPDTEQKLFTAADADAIMSLPASITNLLAMAVMRLSGMTDDAQADLGNVSDSTTEDEPSTT
jgi:hypothetical protein